MNEKSNKTAVEWLIIQIKNDHIDKALTGLEWMKIFEQAKEMEREQMATNCSQLYKPTMIFGEHQIQMLEISDEEIEKCIGDGMHDFYKGGFIEGAKWYREQLKKKQ